MKLARTILARLLILEQLTTTLAFLVMVLVLGADILGRELLGGGKIWATPIAVYANVFISFIGIGIASASGQHLRPKFMDRLAPRKFDAGLDRLTDAGFALFCIGASLLCYRMLQQSIDLQETDPVLQWQVWPFQGFLLAAFALACLRHSIYAGWPALRPDIAGGENSAPSELQLKQYAPTSNADEPSQAERGHR
jgi:TRAP-type C4-dicarboxylate transport system permease small subunit